jgi:predicted metalloprotease with PDZ domain
VQWGSPAFNAALRGGDQIIAVGERAYSEEALKEAVTAAKGSNLPIHLIMKRGDEVTPVDILWSGGLRYPRFEKVGKGDGPLDRLLSPR